MWRAAYYTVFRKKVLHFVFAHNFTKYKLDFVTVFSDRYWVVSLQVCHTARIISGLKYIFFAIKNVRVVRYPRIQHIHNLQKGHNYATAQRIFNWFCQSQITVSWRIHLRIFAESFIKFVRKLLEIYGKNKCITFFLNTVYRRPCSTDVNDKSRCGTLAAFAPCGLGGGVE